MQQPFRREEVAENGFTNHGPALSGSGKVNKDGPAVKERRHQMEERICKSKELKEVRKEKQKTDCTQSDNANIREAECTRKRAGLETASQFAKRLMIESPEMTIGEAARMAVSCLSWGQPGFRAQEHCPGTRS